MAISEEQRTAARKAGATGSLDVTADHALQVAYLMTFLHLTEERRVPRVMR